MKKIIIVGINIIICVTLCAAMLLRSAGTGTELNTHILNELIQKIVVYEKTYNPYGSKNQSVDIHY